MNDKEKADICEELGEPRSIWKILSYNSIGFGTSAASLAISSYAFYFWEVEIGLAVVFVALAFSIYGVWDAINDPLIGFISDKPRKYAEKWGRRFPLIMLGYIPAAIIALFIFLVPGGLDQFGLFLWLTTFLLLFELFFTTGGINHTALYPQLFRTDKERLTASTTNNIFYFGSVFFGIVIPPLFFIFGDPSSFFTGAILIMLIAIPFLLLGIPGCREDARMIQQVLDCEDERQKIGYFQAMKELLTNRNFIANLIYYIAIRVIPALGFGSILYFVRYNLGMEAGMASLVMLGFLIGGLIGIVPCMFLAKKLGFLKTFYIVLTGLTFAMLSVMFIPDFISLMIVVMIVGFCVTGIEISDTPLAAYMMDDVAVRLKHRPEGVYFGVRAFITRLATPIMALSFALTHALTGFDPNAAVQNDLALLGIRIHFGLIPFIFGIIGIIGFYLLWNLKDDKMQEIWAKLKELDL